MIFGAAFAQKTWQYHPSKTTNWIAALRELIVTGP
jgi:hypothetical protein